MDTILLVAAGVFFVIALILTVWAMRERGRQSGREAVLQEQAQSRALALQDQDQELARVHSELDRVREERDKLREDFQDFVDFMVKAGVLRPEVDPLTVSESDLVYEVSGPVPGLPEVASLDKPTLLQALKHASDRTGARADRPFSRRYMVNDGPLTRTQFEALRGALVAGGYLNEPDTPRSGYALTDKGEALLKDVDRGLYED